MNKAWSNTRFESFHRMEGDPPLVEETARTARFIALLADEAKVSGGHDPYHGEATPVGTLPKFVPPGDPAGVVRLQFE